MATNRGGLGGRIVNLSSQAASNGGYRRVPYACSKAAVETLTVALAAELGSRGILVNAVAPGVIATQSQSLDDSEWVARTERQIPVERLGMPEEVAALIQWLMSPAASYVNGAVIPVNGGRST